MNEHVNERDSSAERLAPWVRHRQRSMLRDLVRLAARPGVLSLAGGLPDSRLFPAQAYAAAVSEVLAREPRALQYSPSYEPLREAITGLMARRGVVCSADEVVLTTGAQQGIDIFFRLFVPPGGAIALEQWTYPGALQALAPLDAQVQVAEVDLGVGPRVEQWQRAAPNARSGGPAPVYVVPDAHNPLGMSWSEPRRRQLADLAIAEGRVVLEDDPYGHLWFEHPFDAPLKALAPERVVYAGSFSKILAPGMRLGWLVLPKELVLAATIAKELSDLECSGVTQRVAHRLLSPEIFEDHLERVRGVYARRCAALVNALQRFLPADARFIEPRGGMFLWVELDGIDTLRLCRQAIAEHEVAFVPGVVFASGDCPVSTSLRLSFATLDESEIEEAVRRLGKCVASCSSAVSAGT